MRNLLALIGALVVGFGGLGWYFGWYKVNVTKAPDGNLRIEADVNTKKVGNDFGEGLKKGGEVLNDLGKGANEAKVTQPGPVTAPQHEESGWLFGPAAPKSPMGK